MAWARAHSRAMSEIAAQTQTPYSRFNVFAFFWDFITYYAGTTLLSSVTILPLYTSRLAGRLPHAGGPGSWAALVNHLQNPAILVALIPTLSSFGMLLPQLVGAHLATGRRTYRPLVVRLGICERSLVLGAVLSMVLLARAHASPSLLLFVPMGFVFGWWCCMGVNHPGYTAMLEHTMPVELRGRLFGVGAALGGALGFVVALLATWFLNHLPFPYGFAACGGVAWLILTSGLIPFIFIRETPLPQPHDEERSVHRRIASILHDDRAYWLFLVSQVLFAFQMMPTAVYATYALKRFQANDGNIAVLTAVMAIAGGVGFMFAGPLADRYGNRAVLLWSTVFAGIATIGAWLAPSLTLYIAAFVPISIASSGWQLTAFNIVMEFAPRGRVHTYTAANAIVPGPFRVIAPVLGGVLVAQMGHHGPVFAAAGIAALASAAVLYVVVEPRTRTFTPPNACEQ